MTLFFGFILDYVVTDVLSSAGFQLIIIFHSKAKR